MRSESLLGIGTGSSLWSVLASTYGCLPSFEVLQAPAGCVRVTASIEATSTKMKASHPKSASYFERQPQETICQWISAAISR